MKPLVLIVEDAEDIQLMVKMTLSKQCELAQAGTLVEARGWLQNHAPDLILLDAGLPDGDGFSFCRWLREDPRYREIPVIFLTGRTETFDKVFAFKQGAQDYLTKPFHPEELRARVSAHLQRGHKVTELQYQNMKLDFVHNHVEFGNSEAGVALSQAEMIFLKGLVETPSKSLDFDEMKRILKDVPAGATNASIERFVHTLHAKLKDHGWSLHLTTLTVFLRKGYAQQAA